MTTETLPREPLDWRRTARRAWAVLLTAIVVAVPEVQRHTRPIARHLREHAYSIAGLGCIDAAAFVHSAFTGLLVTGISFLIFEWKVNE
jgi:hypothetical protein